MTIKMTIKWQLKHKTQLWKNSDTWQAHEKNSSSVEMLATCAQLASLCNHDMGVTCVEMLATWAQLAWFL